jgi:hypothetical protein
MVAHVITVENYAITLDIWWYNRSRRVIQSWMSSTLSFHQMELDGWMHIHILSKIYKFFLILCSPWSNLFCREVALLSCPWTPGWCYSLAKYPMANRFTIWQRCFQTDYFSFNWKYIGRKDLAESNMVSVTILAMTMPKLAPIPAWLSPLYLLWL